MRTVASIWIPLAATPRGYRLRNIWCIIGAVRPVLTSNLVYPRYSSVEPEGEKLLGLVSFGESIPLRPLGSATLELWPAGSDVTAGSAGAFRFASDGELLFASASFEESAAIETVARTAYEEAIELIRQQGYPQFLRLWNHLGSINEVENGRERYQSFCAGRHDAFDAARLYETDLPSASAVGMPGRGLSIYFLASRTSGVQVENPRQVAAYHYPPQYGPKSPSFSRATIFPGAEGVAVYISGTSSVLGHASVHKGDVLGQLDETLRNIDAVLQSAITGGGLSDLVSVKTYLRHAADAEAVLPRLTAALPAGCEQIILEADICRSELLIEIEGVAKR